MELLVLRFTDYEKRDDGNTWVEFFEYDNLGDKNTLSCGWISTNGIEHRLYKLVSGILYCEACHSYAIIFSKLSTNHLWLFECSNCNKGEIFFEHRKIILQFEKTFYNDKESPGCDTCLYSLNPKRIECIECNDDNYKQILKEEFKKVCKVALEIGAEIQYKY